MKKFALVLSGGGFKGAFQIGALRMLRNNWHLIDPDSEAMKFDIIAGVSVGSLNGVLTACDEFDALERLWRDIGANVENIYTSDFIDTRNQTDQVKMNLDLRKIIQMFIPNAAGDFNLWKGLGMALSKSKLRRFTDEVEREFTDNFKHFRAIADNTPLRSRLTTLVHREKVRDCIYKCGFVSLNDGRYYSYPHTAFRSDEDFRNAVLASTAMPIVWTPVENIVVVEDGREHSIRESVDGGIRNVSPLSDVIDEINNDDPSDEYTIIIINCNSGEVHYEEYNDANIAGIALRSLNDIAITEIFNNDISEFLRINDVIAQVSSAEKDFKIFNYNRRGGRTKKVLRHFKPILIEPDPDILGDPLVANERLNATRMRHGEDKAAKAIALHHEDGGSDRPVIV